jgi:hypothetical protein
VLENNTAAHKCVQFTVNITIPQALKQSKHFEPPTLPLENEVSLAALAARGEEALVNEVVNFIMQMLLMCN